MRWCLLVIFSSIHVLAINEGWNPPTGIPRPAFGITNSVDMYRPEHGITFTFSDARGTSLYPTNEHGPYTHYVDKTVFGATDTANPYGTPEKPRVTWPNPANTPAGAAIQVNGGPLALPYNFNNGAPGSKMGMGSDAATPERPVFFYTGGLKATDCVPNYNDLLTNKLATLDTNLMFQMAATGMVWISRSEMHQYGNNTIVEGFASTNGNWNLRAPLKGAGITNVVIRECFGAGNSGSGSGSWLSLGGDESEESQYTMNIVAFRNIGSRFGEWNPGTGSQSDDRTMCIIDGVTTNAWLLDSLGFELGGDFCRIGANIGDPKMNYFLYVGRNRTFRNAENGIDVKGARKAVVSENIMHDMSNTAGGTSILVVHQNDSEVPAPEDIWIVNNVAWDTNREDSRGFVHTGAAANTDIWWIGNELYDFDEYAFYIDRSGGNHHLINNTVAFFAVNGLRTSSTITSLHGTNNIFYNRTGTGPHITVTGPSLASDTMFYSAFFQPGGGSYSITWGSSTYSSVSAWISGTAVGDGSTDQDPLFVDAGARDFNLTFHSPCKDTGTDISSVDVVFKAMFGSDVTILRDRNGTLRGSGDGYDMGALEYMEVEDGATPSGRVSRGRLTGGARLR